MENTKRKNSVADIQAIQPELRRPKRKRSATTLKLQWVAERVRKCRRIKEALANGTYHVDSREVAKAILNVEDEKVSNERKLI